MTTETEEYNGHPNRETWAMSMHLDNHEPWYRWSRELAEQVNNDYDRHRLAETLKDAVETWAEEFYYPEPVEIWRDVNMRDLLVDVGSLWRVDWEHIAQNLVTEVAEAES